jgi:carboxymethylenebutenolidase
MDIIQSEELEITVDGAALQGFIAHPAQPGPGVLVLHAWWGLTPFFKDLCRRLAAEGFTAFAPDLNEGKTADTIEGAEQLMAARDYQHTQATALAALRWFNAQYPQQGGLGLIGFSMGASWALQLSSQAADAVKAVVLFYDVQPIDFTTVRAHFLGHYGETDVWTKVEWSREMEADMRQAGVQVDFYRYPAGHWFFEANRPDAYAPAEAELAWQRSLNFFKAELME